MSKSNNMILNIILCVRNEEKTIKIIIDKILNLKISNVIIKTIVVDNCSTDKTKKILQKIKNKNIKIIFQKKNIGKGHSVKTAINLCKGDFIIPQDADLEYDPKYIKNIVEYALKYRLDFVIGSRVKKNKRFHKYLINEIGANALTFFFNMIFFSNFTDVASCYKLMNLKILKKFNLKCNGFDLDYELAAKFVKKRYKYGEVPIKYKSRSYKEGRKTKIFIDGIKAFFVIIKERIL